MRRLLTLCALAAGCGGGSTYNATTASTASSVSSGPAATADYAPAPSPSRGSWWHHSQAAPPPPAPALGWHVGGGGAPPAPMEAPPAEERPGLATQWGENRVSRVHDTAFVRADPAPFAQVAVYYNDAAGVAAMARHEVRLVSSGDTPVAVQGGVAISVVGEGGAPLDAFSLGGRVHVVGEAGQRYMVVLKNQTELRYEAVLSVDGLDVIDGKTGSLDKRGYVIEPHGTLVVDGFRRSNDVVAAFRFGAVSSSYAARSGSGQNVGVIGVALFGEQGAQVWPAPSDEELERRLSADPFAGSRFAQPPN